jgi:hypothetical protein
MTKSTFSVNGGALPRFDRGTIMRRAWAIFRQAYKYPAIKFASIGWKCFGGCVRQAWAEAKDAARIAAIPAADKAARILELSDTIRFAPFNESWRQASREISSARADLARLSA